MQAENGEKAGLVIIENELEMTIVRNPCFH